MSLESLRKSNSLDKLLNAVKEDSAPQEGKKSYKDDRLWKPELDKSGNGYAVLRFLPSCEGEDLPWAKLWSHAFQGPTGQWYIENSRTTIGSGDIGKDPVSEHNTALWNTGIESDKEIARKQKRKLQYYSNVYVVSDAKHPENEGKVFLFRYGKKIFDKIMESMQPAFPDDVAVNPFDFWEGANFKLKIRKVDGYWNYDKSEFDSPTAIFKEESAIESTWKKQYPLDEFTNSNAFKSYDELKTRLDIVLSGKTTVGNVTDTLEDAPVAAPVVDTKEVSAPIVETQVEESDDSMDYFNKLANA
jgi:hypothetical protein|tara:strand:+ start:844 stop:1749 length:906 start_codon:yes stop_codon:yes gene_type:complete